LQEVVVRAGFNPAHRIIKLATQNRKSNDPAELPNSRTAFTTKPSVTFEPEKANLSDTLSHSKKAKNNLSTKDQLQADSGQKETEAFFAKSYLFLSESISDHAFLKPNLDKETVLATRVAGLQEPELCNAGHQQPGLFGLPGFGYLFEKSYLSPISEGSTRKYDFQLEDTTYAGNDTIFIISYKPLPGKNFEGLKGQLHISSDGWAVENIIAESNEKEQQGIRLQQHYQKIDGQKWFPVQVNTDFEVKALQGDNQKPVAFTRSYYTNINLRPNLKRREFQAVTIKMNEDAGRQPEAFWEQHRPDTLNAKERTTYVKIDSLGKASANLDARFRMLEAMFSKRLPMGPVSIDLDKAGKN
jgi:hypothetical protein